jgi:hypothetical protein
MQPPVTSVPTTLRTHHPPAAFNSPPHSAHATRRWRDPPGRTRAGAQALHRLRGRPGPGCAGISAPHSRQQRPELSATTSSDRGRSPSSREIRRSQPLGRDFRLRGIRPALELLAALINRVWANPGPNSRTGTYARMRLWARARPRSRMVAGDRRRSLSNVATAGLRWGTRGPEFESRRPDYRKPC